MEGRPHFSFFSGRGLNLEQVLGRVDRNCGEWIALSFFFGWSLGTRARRSSKKLWRVDRTFLFFFVSSLSLLCLFSVSSLSLLCLFAFVLSLPLPSTLFFSDPNFGQVLGRAYRDCGKREVGIADFSFFFFLRRPRRKKNQRTSGRCQAELTEIAEGRPHFFFFSSLNLFFHLIHSFYLFFHLFKSFSIFLPLFPSFSLFFTLFPLFPLFSFFSFSFFVHFHIFFTLFHFFSFFSSFSSFFFFSLFLPFFTSFSPFSHYFPFFQFFLFLFRILFRIFADLAAAAALPPYLAFLYLTSHYLSSPFLP